MKHIRILRLIIVIVFLTACRAEPVGLPLGDSATPNSTVAQPTSTQSNASLGQTPVQAATLAPSSTPRPSATLTPQPTNTPTQTPIPTHDPSVYDPYTIGDSRNLDSFIISVVQRTSGNAITEKYQWKIEYSRQPLNIHQTSDFSTNRSDAYQKKSKGEAYQVGDWVYMAGMGSGFSVQPAGRDYAGLYNKADMRYNAGISYFNSAKYIGQETYQGDPAYHYTVDQTNLKSNLGNLKIDKAQGDIYLAVIGNYLLHYNFSLVGKVVVMPGQVDFGEGKLEYSGDMTGINQPLEITLPAQYNQVIFDPGVPLPQGTTLDLIGFSDIGQTGYTYTTTSSLDEFLAFYKKMPPTDGWSMVQAGDITTPESCQNCVLVSKGSVEATLKWQDRMDHFVIVIQIDGKL
jgi:hypothetical protein